jgi:hypothetical protein
MKALQITLLSLSFSLSSFSCLISFPSPHPSLPISHVFFVSQKMSLKMEWREGSL